MINKPASSLALTEDQVELGSQDASSVDELHDTSPTDQPDVSVVADQQATVSSLEPNGDEPCRETMTVSFAESSMKNNSSEEKCNYIMLSKDEYQEHHSAIIQAR